MVASRWKRRIYLFCPCAQLCTLEIVSPFTLYLNWQLIIYELQLWRWGGNHWRFSACHSHGFVQVGDLLLVLGHVQFALLLEYLGLGVPVKGGGVCETVVIWCNMYSDALTFIHSGVRMQTHKQNVCNLDNLLGRIDQKG